jgi:hypothetical protein
MRHIRVLRGLRGCANEQEKAYQRVLQIKMLLQSKKQEKQHVMEHQF